MMQGTDDIASSPLDMGDMPSDSEPDASVSTAAIYARTSGTKPDHHYSIDEQIRRCWKQCQQHGWDVNFVFTDEGQTGRNTERGDFQDMIEKATQGCFDIVVFWKLDRFARSVVDLVNIEQTLSEHDVALQSVTEYIDTSSPVGRFTFRNLASAAELESDLTSQRVQMGMHAMARKHRWPNASPPFGYELTDEQTLTIIDEEAAVVRRIYNDYIDKRSMPQVAYDLNGDGVTTKRDGEWDRWSVRKLLANDLYRGQYQLGDYEEYVEEYRIVSDELFEAVTETRYRFKHAQESVPEDRKQATVNKILGEFRAANE
jgi:site-specific DNA recombinase